MKVIESLAELRAARRRWGRVGLVPTMGFLHEAHLSLLRAARSGAETVVMSIFVNPAQFGPSEDFAAYPRDAERDLRLAEEAGVDVVFMPSQVEVYPPGFDTWVEVGSIARRWEGERRPGHFRGVATVVLKLFEMVQPTLTYFGEKDYQQLLVIKKMALDFNLPLEVLGCPTVREPSGLALSSRNLYLRDDRRKKAAVLSEALMLARGCAAQGAQDVHHLDTAMRELISREPDAHIDYLAIVNERTLEPLTEVSDRARVLAAMHFDGVRLIDNIELVIGSGSPPDE